MKFDIKTLTQIYNFTLEKKKFEHKENQMVIVDFFKNIHYGDISFFYYEKNTVNGNFGKNESIDIKNGPNFEQKSEFLKWVIIRLNS